VTETKVTYLIQFHSIHAQTSPQLIGARLSISALAVLVTLGSWKTASTLVKIFPKLQL
jgi:hypothetical protein